MKGLGMFKKIIITSIATLMLSNVFAQDKNTLYVEGAGAAILYSLNYERQFTDKLSLRVGFSSVPMSASEDHDHDHDHGEEDVKFTIIPIMANYLIGSGNHKLALSGGVIQVSASADTEDGEYDLDLGMLPSASVGYRYQRAAGGFFFNANVGITPIAGWPGFGIGWTF